MNEEKREGLNNVTGLPVEYMTVIKVKLPDPGAYHSGPSGDTDFDRAYKDAIFSAKPRGFEVKWPRANQRWPVDSEGFTYVPLYLTYAEDAVAAWQERVDSLEKRYANMRNGIRALIGLPAE